MKRKAAQLDDNSDDVEAICEAIETKAKRECNAEAKSLLLFGSSLFPDNFKLKFLNYKLAKKRSDFETAATVLREMYTKFPNDLYNELTDILEDVRADRSSENKELFSRLPTSVQHDILRKFSQTMDSPLDKASLLLVAMRSTAKHSQLAAEESAHVFALLAEAEEAEYPSGEGQTSSVLNVYRMRLACDLLPIVHQARKYIKKLDKRQLEVLVFKSLQFCLAYATYIPMPAGDSADRSPIPVIAGLNTTDVPHSRLQNVWLYTRHVLDMASNLLKWSRSMHTFRSVSVDAISQHMHQQARKMSYQELGCVFWIAFAESIMAYLRLARPTLFGGVAGKAPGVDHMFFLVGRSSNDQERWSWKPETSHQKKILDAFNTAARVYSAVGKDLAHIAEKVEPRLRVPAWRFDELFLLDLHVSNMNWPAAEASFASVGKQMYPRAQRDFLRAVFAAQTGNAGRSELKKAVKLFLDCLSSLPEEIIPVEAEGPTTDDGVLRLIEIRYCPVFSLVIDLLITWLCKAASSNPDHSGVALPLVILCQVNPGHYSEALSQGLQLSGRHWGKVKSSRLLHYLSDVDILEHMVYLNNQLEKTGESDEPSDLMVMFHEKVKTLSTITLTQQVITFLREDKAALLSCFNHT